MLDVSSDVDHNRTVITFAASPQVITEAAFRGIETASRLIDLDQHRGVHPRIGATDVVPLIPLRDVTMPECVTIAHDLGRRVGEELGIPVYFYEYAATRPDRRNLADVRRQPYEQLKQTIKSDADRKPDYGPARLGKVGATAIGAREPLIAFNAFLNTDNVEIAVKIAEAVRESGGGLPYLKALGLLVEGKAQVSMNVIDFRRTSLYTIWERVKLEASKHGVLITHTEIVGLIPQAAFRGALHRAAETGAVARERQQDRHLHLRSGRKPPGHRGLRARHRRARAVAVGRRAGCKAEAEHDETGGGQNLATGRNPGVV
jgi:glutamate formiminotransferase